MTRRRVLVVGAYQRPRMESGMARAFRRLGHDVLLVDPRRVRRLAGHALTQRWTRLQARRFRPDFVLLGKCTGLELDTVHELVRGRDNALWYLDAPWFKHLDRPDIRHTLEAGKLARTFFVSGFVPEWKALGVNAKFLPAAADREIVPVAPHPDYAAEVTFTGTGYSPERAEFLMALAGSCRLKVWGNGWEPYADRLDWGGRAVEGRDFARACSSSAVVLGINPPLLAGGQMVASNRMWISILAGGFYLGQHLEGMDRLLRGGEHCAWYTDLASCVAEVRRWVADPAARERVRAAGEQVVRAHHTFDQRALDVLADREWTNPLGE